MRTSIRSMAGRLGGLGLVVALGLTACSFGGGGVVNAEARDTVAYLIAEDQGLHHALDAPMPPAEVAAAAAAALPERLAALEERTALVWSDPNVPERAEMARPYLTGRASSGDMPQAVDVDLYVEEWVDIDVADDRIAGIVRGQLLQRWVHPPNPEFMIDVGVDGWQAPAAERATYRFVVVREEDGWRLEELTVTHGA